MEAEAPKCLSWLRTGNHHVRGNKTAKKGRRHGRTELTEVLTRIAIPWQKVVIVERGVCQGACFWQNRNPLARFPDQKP